VQQAVPTITSLTTSIGPVGAVGAQALSVVIVGGGFGSSQGTINAPGINVSVISWGPTAINTTFSIPTTVAGGNKSVSVTVGGSTSNSVPFFVQIPTRLVRANFPGDPPAGAPNGYGPLQMPVNQHVVDAAGQVVSVNPQCGVYRNLTYWIVDQQNPPVPIQGLMNVAVAESFSNCTGVGCPPPAVTRVINLVNYPSQADLLDTLYLGREFQSCLDTNEKQTFRQNFSVKIGETTFAITSFNTVLIGNDDGQLKVDVTLQ